MKYAILKSLKEFETLQNDILNWVREINPTINATKWSDINKHQSKELYACIVPEWFGYPVEETRIYQQWDIEDESLIGKEYKITTLQFDKELVEELPKGWYKETDII